MKRAAILCELPTAADLKPPIRLDVPLRPHLALALLLDRLAAGAAAPGERKSVVRHLLAGCAVCSRRLAGHSGGPGGAGPSLSDKDYDRALDRSIERALATID